MSEKKIGTVKQTIALPYEWSMGETATKWFEELKKGKIMGTYCEGCGRVLVPARKFCPRCFIETTKWVQVSDKGVIETFTILTYEYPMQPKKPPYGVAGIKLDGADVAFLHFLGGIDFSNLEEAVKKIRIGMRVQAVWKPPEKREGNIFDIEYFKPIE